MQDGGYRVGVEKLLQPTLCFPGKMLSEMLRPNLAAMSLGLFTLERLKMGSHREELDLWPAKGV